MSPAVLMRYLVGDREAVLQVARSPTTLWVGAVLVVTAGVARNHDQIFIGANPLWPLRSLVASLVVSFFIFCFVFALGLNRRLTPERPRRFWRSYRVFLSLFWMTAPVAWLYAIPAERLLGPLSAAALNIALLAIVSAWRVALLTRALAVVAECPWWKLLPRVLAPASLLMVVASVATQLSIVQIMGGMAHSPEEGLLVDASATLFWLAGITFFVVWPWMAGTKIERARPLYAEAPRPAGLRPSAAVCAATLGAWCAIAILPQVELARNHRVESLMRAGAYREALDYVATLAPDDLSPTRPLFPDPWEGGAFRHLGGVFEALGNQDPGWVRRTYLAHAGIAIRHDVSWGGANWLAAILKALPRLDEGGAWLAQHRRVLDLSVGRLGRAPANAWLEPLYVETLAKMGAGPTPAEGATVPTTPSRTDDR